MKPKIQQKLSFTNKSNCLVDLDLLEKAMLWYAKDNLISKRVIYMHGCYPGVSVFKVKIHVHRLVKSYLEGRVLHRTGFVHHKNGNKLDARQDNLELMLDKTHQSIHNKGRKFSEDHKSKIAIANKARKGMYYKAQRTDVTPKMVFDMIEGGLTINAISKKLNLDHSCVKKRYDRFIYEHPNLLEK